MLVALVALTGAALALVAFHQASMSTLGLSRGSLAAARAREAASTGVALARAGLGINGVLPGGASWVVVIDSSAPGVELVWSIGTSTRPQPARLEVGAVWLAPDSSASPGGLSAPPVGWIVLRHE